jgi:competence protein ComEC
VASRPSQAAETLEIGPETIALRPRRALAPRQGPAAPGVQVRSLDFGLLVAAERAFEERRLFVLLPFAIIAGLIVSLAASSEPEPTALLAVGAGITVAAPVSVRSIAAVRMVALAAAFWLGFSLLSIHGALFGTAMLSRPAYGTFEMRVDEIVSEQESGRRVVVSAVTPVAGSREVPMRRARIVVRGDASLAPGDTIRGPVRFYPVPGPVIPGGFDTQFHAYFDGIGAYGNTTKPVEVVRAGEASSPERWIEGVREAIAARIDRDLTQPAAGIARALITGDQSVVTDEARDVMATAGLAHVLSVSGLHLTIVAGGVFVALRMLLSLFPVLGRFLSVKRLAAAGGIMAGLAYFAISGGNVAALRATVMILLVFGAVIVGRRALTMRNVAIAALVVLLSDPASVFRPSFQLSFAAVVALIGAWELARHREGRDRNLVRQAIGYFGGIAATSLVAGAATLLFSVYHFQQTSPLGVVGNLVSLPLVGFVMMPAAGIAALAMPLGFEAPFLNALGWSIDRMLEVARLVAGWSAGFDVSPLLTPLALILGLGALAWFAFFQTWHRLIAPVLLVPAVLLFALDRPPDVLIADTTQAVALRFEQGLAVVAGKPQGFAIDVWRETYSEKLEAGAIPCDSVACIATSPRGFRVAIVKDPAGFFEECGADLVITRRTAPASCRAGTVIDSEDLAVGGVHWLAWDAAARRFEVRRAIPERVRPWRPAP